MKYKASEELYSFFKVLVKPEYKEEVLNKACHYYEIGAGVMNISPIQSRLNIEMAVFLNDNYFKQVQEYNPNIWNNYPEVEPPECGYYRVEALHVNVYNKVTDKTRKECWFWTGSYWEWVNAPGRAVNLNCYSNIKFKPWDI